MRPTDGFAPGAARDSIGPCPRAYDFQRAGFSLNSLCRSGSSAKLPLPVRCGRLTMVRDTKVSGMSEFAEPGHPDDKQVMLVVRFHSGPDGYT